MFFGSVLNLSSFNDNKSSNSNGINDCDFSDRFVSSAEDINGDNKDALIIGTDGSDPNGNNSGQSYVILGSSNGFANIFNLFSVNDSNGFIINRIKASDFSDRFLSSAEDINGDGKNEVIIGKDGSDPNGSNSGQSYVINKNNFY